jgi:Uri superfamily endonuclease
VIFLKGSYLLVLSIKKRVGLKPGSLSRVELPPGCYVYVGSAKGPGGFEKRVSRHLRRIKKARWHIDYLTRINGVRVESVFYTPPEYDEPMLTRFLSSLGLHKIVKGFGTTDHPDDFSHLLFSEGSVKETVRKIESEMKRKRLSFRLFEKDSLRSLLQ